MPSLDGKVAIITGTSSGFGQAIAVHFAKLGAKLVLTARKEDGLKECKAECIKAGAPEKNVVYVLGDITDTNVRKAVVQKAIDEFGQLDILINNAGLNIANSLADGTGGLDKFDKLMDINVKAPIELCYFATEHLIKTKGSIVNISSVSAFGPLPHISYYGLTKNALNYFTRALAQELAPKQVRVNSICPGAVMTNMLKGILESTGSTASKDLMLSTHPIGRLGEPIDIAKACAFFASDESDWITGDIMTTDGGFMVRPGEKLLG